MPAPTQTTRVPPQSITTYSYSSNSTVGSPPAFLSSYNNTMQSYTRAQIQEFSNAASTTTNATETRNSSSTAGTSSNRGSVGSNQGYKASIASHDFAQVGRRA